MMKWLGKIIKYLPNNLEHLGLYIEFFTNIEDFKEYTSYDALTKLKKLDLSEDIINWVIGK